MNLHRSKDNKIYKTEKKLIKRNYNQPGTSNIHFQEHGSALWPGERIPLVTGQPDAITFLSLVSI